MEQKHYIRFDLLQNKYLNMAQLYRHKLNFLFMECLTPDLLTYETLIGKNIRYNGLNINIPAVYRLFSEDENNIFFEDEDEENVCKWLEQKKPRKANRQKITDLLTHRFKDYNDCSEYVKSKFSRQDYIMEQVDHIKKIFNIKTNYLYDYQQIISDQYEKERDEYDNKLDFEKWNRLGKEKDLPRYYSN